MKTMKTPFRQMLASVPADVQQEVDLEVAISNRINELMEKRGLSKLEFAQALGKRPSEVTKWLSGQHNFTIRTLSLLTAYFGEPLIQVCKQCGHTVRPYKEQEVTPMMVAEP